MKKIALLLAAAFLTMSAEARHRSGENDYARMGVRCTQNHSTSPYAISEDYELEGVYPREAVDMNPYIVDGCLLNAAGYALLRRQSDSIEDQIITIYPYLYYNSYGRIYFELADGRIGVAEINLDLLKKRMLSELKRKGRTYNHVRDFPILVNSQRKNVAMRRGYYDQYVIGTTEVFTPGIPCKNGDYDREAIVDIYVTEAKAQDIMDRYQTIGTSTHSIMSFTASGLCTFGNGKKPPINKTLYYVPQPISVAVN